MRISTILKCSEKCYVSPRCESTAIQYCRCPCELWVNRHNLIPQSSRYIRLQFSQSVQTFTNDWHSIGPIAFREVNFNSARICICYLYYYRIRVWDAAWPLISTSSWTYLNLARTLRCRVALSLTETDIFSDVSDIRHIVALIQNCRMCNFVKLR